MDKGHIHPKKGLPGEAQVVILLGKKEDKGSGR